MKPGILDTLAILAASIVIIASASAAVCLPPISPYAMRILYFSLACMAASFILQILTKEKP